MRCLYRETGSRPQLAADNRVVLVTFSNVPSSSIPIGREYPTTDRENSGYAVLVRCLSVTLDTATMA